MDNEIFIEENCIKEEATINLVWANIFGLIVLVVAVPFFGIPFYFVWAEKFAGFGAIYPLSAIYLLLFFPLVVIHELIHGMFFSLFSNNKFRSVKFGIMPAQKLFTPYCHCSEKLKIKHYRIALLMPLLITGIIPTIISLFFGNALLFFWGIIGIMAGSGDLLIFFKTIKEKKNSWIFDHPTEAGYFIYRPVNKEQ
jgi:hypothetical protein